MEKHLKVGILVALMTFLSSIAEAVPRELFEEWSVDFRDSISYLEKEIEAHPDSYRLRFVLGTLYFELGIAKVDTKTNEVAQASLLMLDKAEKEFKEVLKLKKNDSMSYYYLGHIAMQKSGNLEQAIDYYKKAIESDKHNYKAYIKLHYLYLAEKKYDSAVEVLENAKRYFKGDAVIYHRLGLTYLFMNKYDKVIENAKIALSFGKNTETQIMLASAYSLTGKYDNAKIELEDVLNADPKNKTALLGLSVVFSKTGKKQKAIEILKKAQGFYPEDAEIKKQLEELR